MTEATSKGQGKEAVITDLDEAFDAAIDEMFRKTSTPEEIAEYRAKNPKAADLADKVLAIIRDKGNT